jgi:hypothetical protein
MAGTILSAEDAAAIIAADYQTYLGVGGGTTPDTPITVSFHGAWGLVSHELELDYAGSAAAGTPDPVQIEAISFSEVAGMMKTTYSYNDTATLDPTNPSVQFAIGTPAGASSVSTIPWPPTISIAASSAHPS